MTASPAAPEPPLYVYRGPHEGVKLLVFPELPVECPVALRPGDTLELRWGRAGRPSPREACDRCDGCGWYEGGVTLKTPCEKCGGTGFAARKAIEAAAPAPLERPSTIEMVNQWPARHSDSSGDPFWYRSEIAEELVRTAQAELLAARRELEAGAAPLPGLTVAQLGAWLMEVLRCGSETDRRVPARAAGGVSPQGHRMIDMTELTPEQLVIYDQGYQDGESAHFADWAFALIEWCELPEDVDLAPTAIAQYIATLQARAGSPGAPA